MQVNELYESEVEPKITDWELPEHPIDPIGALAWVFEATKLGK